MKLKKQWLDFLDTDKITNDRNTLLPADREFIKNNIKTVIKYKSEIDKVTRQEIFKKSIYCSRLQNIEKKVSKGSIKRKSSMIKFGICKKQILGETETGITTPCPDELS
jgi:hypothetical protein